MVFRATRVEGSGRDFRVTGDLTIRDITRPVTFVVEVGGIVPGMSGARHVGLTARARIEREAWDLTWNVGLEAGGWLVGKEVALEIEVAADEVAVTANETVAVPAIAA
jgi:polyisoprenoid-binding protein YceI